MFENPLFETLIALVLIYAFLSILVSILTEWWNQQKKHRAVMLQKAITELLNNAQGIDLTGLLYKHPLIDRISKTLPEYISAATFADALIDTIGHAPVKEASAADPAAATNNTGDTEDPMARFYATVQAMKDGELKNLLLFFYERSKNSTTGKYEFTRLRNQFITWYDEKMAQLTGTFKLSTRKRTLIWGFAIAIVLNVDSINLVRTFMQDSNLRKEVVGDADMVAGIWQNTSDSLFSVKISKLLDSVSVYKAKGDSTGKTAKLEYAVKTLSKLKTISDSTGQKQLAEGSEALGLLDSYNIPIGWDKEAAPLSWLPWTKDVREKNKKQLASVKGSYIEAHNNYPTFVSWLLYFVGIAITAFSLSYGAPFWFDMLVKLVNIRRSGLKPEPKTK